MKSKYFRLPLEAALASALYGFSVGSVHSLNFALRNLIKFPALILITASVCALAFYLVSRFITRELSFGEVQLLALGIFRDIALLLASLCPVGLFLAHTIKPPDLLGLNEYPFFLGLNVIFIAGCGTVALVARTRQLLRRPHLKTRAGLAIILAWLLISLLTGAQTAWYLRPFCGVATIPADQTPFFLGRRPDIRGDTNFYDAVFHLVNPPPLDHKYYQYRW